MSDESTTKAEPRRYKFWRRLTARTASRSPLAAAATRPHWTLSSGRPTDRERGLKRLERRFRTDRLTKDKLNNRGYNRFLTLSGDASIRIDYDKVAKDARLDGYKGYTTNSSLPDERIIEEYGHLFMIERAFRFCKTDLDIRPMYHRLINRIEAHVCICFVAYTIMLELERILKSAGSKITLERARFLAERIYQITYVNMQLIDKKQ